MYNWAVMEGNWGKKEHRRVLLGLLVLVAAAALSSCAGLGPRGDSDAAYMGVAQAESGAGYAPEPAPSAERSSAAMDGAVAKAAGDLSLPSDPPGETAEEPETVERLRVFSADLQLIVASIEQSRTEIIVTVEGAGGYIESSQADFLVVRVPAATFNPVLEEIESVGEVRSRQVRTADVTDQFFDLERRLLISQTSRDRLLELLEQTDDADERVRILRDIRRLTEEIEQLRSALESLEQLIQFSRITVRLISRIQASTIGQQQIPFPWIRALSPVGAGFGEAESDIGIVPGDEFAVFSEGRSVFAEAADGTQLRAGAVVNQPRGDEEFWQAALLFHLEPFYRSITAIAAGEYRGVLVESRDTRPFSYLILTRARETELVIVEVFFPEPMAVESRLEDVLNDIEGGLM